MLRYACLALGLPLLLSVGTLPAATGTFTFNTEVKRPDMTQEARDTAPKYNPTAHLRPTTKEEAGNFHLRDILATRYSEEVVRAALAQARPFRPFPPAGDPAYRALPDEERAAIIREAETALGYDWPTLTAALYLVHYETGSLREYHRRYMKRLKTLEILICAEILEGEGRFIRDIANGVWAFCEQTSWATPAHLNVETPGAGLPSHDHVILGLLAAEAGALLATAEYFFADELDALNPVFRQRMQHEVKTRLLTPYLERTDYWWMAYEKPFTNNWNPWITSNFLLAAFVFSETEEEKAAYVLKALDVLDHFLNVYPDDGGCEEGPAYWDHAGGRLLDCLRLLGQATGGLIDIYDEPLIREMGNFMWYASIHQPWYVNFADAFAKYTPDPSTLFRYGKAVGSDNLMAFAKRFPIETYLSGPRIEYVFMRQLPNLFSRADLIAYDGSFQAADFITLPDLETAYVRQSTDTGTGFYLAAKGGYNAESHNHNDVGNFIVFLDGEPLFIDVGAGTYTSKTFTEQRYEIWSMQSSYHNLPDINGHAQPHMVQWQSDFFHAEETAQGARIEVGLTSAYPAVANVENYVRTLEFNRAAEAIQVEEALVFREDPTTDRRDRLDFHLMTHHRPAEGTVPGQILLTVAHEDNARAMLTYPPELDVIVTEVFLEDPRLASNWGDRIYRITLRATLRASQREATYPFVIRRP